jgi:hypothetical protein
MKPKISAAILVIIGLVEVSANAARYAQSIKPQQPTTTTTNNIQTTILDLYNSSLVSADVRIGQDSLTNLFNTCPTGLVDDRTIEEENIAGFE